MTAEPTFQGSVVVATDGSDAAHRAVRWAAAQARWEHRPLTVLHCGDDDTAAAVGLSIAQRAEPGLEARAVEVHTAARPGLVAASATAHLLVLGSRGRGATASRVLGSVSAGVARQAHCPVVVCREHRRGIRDGVVVAADLEPESREVLTFAFRMASVRGLPLTVLTCTEDPTNAGEREGARWLSEALAGLGEKFPDVHLSRRVAYGDVVGHLTESRRPWDLMVIGRHHVAGVVGHIGATTATRVLEHAAAPVAVVPVSGLPTRGS